VNILIEDAWHKGQAARAPDTSEGVQTVKRLVKASHRRGRAQAERGEDTRRRVLAAAEAAATAQGHTLTTIPYRGKQRIIDAVREETGVQDRHIVRILKSYRTRPKP
jgi:hypothetical protein